MSGLRFTLLGDGPSDRVLLHPVRWALRRANVRVEVGQWADLGRVKPRPTTLQERIRIALELYPADLLLVHRDAESASREHRMEEVRRAAARVSEHFVAVIPVRMTEAWLLHDEAAIRRASGNPNGKIALQLVPPERAERDADPKRTLHTALLTAADLGARRRKKKSAAFGEMRARTAELISDYEPLCGAPAFQSFLDDLHWALSQIEHSLPS